MPTGMFLPVGELARRARRSQRKSPAGGRWAFWRLVGFGGRVSLAAGSVSAAGQLSAMRLVGPPQPGARQSSSRAMREVVRRRRDTHLLQRAPHHASAAVAMSMAGPGWRNRDRGDFDFA